MEKPDLSPISPNSESQKYGLDFDSYTWSSDSSTKLSDNESRWIYHAVPQSCMQDSRVPKAGVRGGWRRIQRRESIARGGRVAIDKKRSTDVELANYSSECVACVKGDRRNAESAVRACATSNDRVSCYYRRRRRRRRRPGIGR